MGCTKLSLGPVSYLWVQCVHITQLSNFVIIFEFHHKSSIIIPWKGNLMKFLPVEGILSTNIFNSIRNKNFWKNICLVMP